jgi:CRP-like cAMP-binding protein
MTPDVEPETGRSLVEDGRRLLGECKLFRGLGADERRTLLARSRIRNFAAGETIFLMGSPGDNMMAVLSGNVRISLSSSDGRELLLAILFPGEFFGEPGDAAPSYRARKQVSCLRMMSRSPQSFPGPSGRG